MSADVHQIVIVEPGAAQQAVLQGEPEWLHEMKPGSDIGAEPNDVAGVTRYLGSHQHHLETLRPH